jgi:hypothetical protein
MNNTNGSKTNRLTGLAKELRTAYFRTAAGTLNCSDAEAWRRVADAAEAWCSANGRAQ